MKQANGIAEQLGKMRALHQANFAKFLHACAEGNRYTYLHPNAAAELLCMLEFYGVDTLALLLKTESFGFTTVPAAANFQAEVLARQLKSSQNMSGQQLRDFLKRATEELSSQSRALEVERRGLVFENWERIVGS